METRDLLVEMTTKYNSVISRQSEVDGRIREVKEKIDMSRSVNQT